MKRNRWLLLLGPLVLLLAAGSAFLMVKWRGWETLVDADQLAREPAAGAAAEPGNPAGQTFVARHAGLSGIDFFLIPHGAVPVSVTLHLRTDPTSQVDLATATIQLPAGAGPEFYRFAFPPFKTSHGQRYYAFLEPSGANVTLALAGGGAYLDGAAYQAHEPLDAQATFRLVYASGSVILDLLKAALGWAGLLAVSGLLFVLPGWALLAWLLPERRLAWPEMLGLAAGVSLALVPLLILWTYLAGLQLGALYAWLPAALGLVALLIRHRTWRPRHGRESIRQWGRSEAFWPDLALLVTLALVFGVRLLVVRTLEAPMWGDSYQHTVLAQLMVDNGGLFDSWEPYAPYHSLTVHFGFPTAAALLAWVAGLDGVRATLLAGQLINGLAALTLYPLAVRLANGNRWAGVGAVLVAGLLSPMPAYYVNWGRYAQLAGQTVLPVALWLLWQTAESERPVWKTAGLAAVTVAGMALAYYRMPIYYAAFVLAWLVGWGLPHWGVSFRSWAKGLARLAVVAGAAVVLLLPVGMRVLGGSLAEGLGTGVTTASPLERVLADYQAWRDVAASVPPSLLLAALAALLWSLVRRRWSVASVGLWVLGLASLVAGQLVRLPGSNYIQNFAVVIFLYIPVSLLAGWLFGQVAELTERWGKGWIPGLAIVVLAGWAAMGQTRIVNPVHIMVTHPDTQAMAWIEQNTPTESLFLVEGFRIYGGRSAVGADAGWWIPMLAGRQNTMPPQYALLNEAPAEPDYNRRVVELVATLETESLASPEGIRSLCEWGITHVYVGQGRGEVGAGVAQLFAPSELSGSPAYREVYHQDRVLVFALNPEACGAER